MLCCRDKASLHFSFLFPSNCDGLRFDTVRNYTRFRGTRRPEDGGSNFLGSTDNHLHTYKMSEPKISQSGLSLCENVISVPVVSFPLYSFLLSNFHFYKEK
jgi:hypothetical protein